MSDTGPSSQRRTKPSQSAKVDATYAEAKAKLRSRPRAEMTPPKKTKPKRIK